MADLSDMVGVVIDNGSGSIKIGYGGDSHPTAILSSIIGRPKNPQAMIGIGSKGTFVGDEAQNKRGLLALSHPIQHGSIVNFDDAELLWQHAYTSGLKGAASEEHPLLITEPPLNSKKNREKLAEIFFEKFNIPALIIATQAFLALYATGRTTGLVLDVGAGLTQAVPIWEGYCLPNAIVRLDWGGHDLDTYMMQLINQSGYNCWSSDAELQISRQIKEKYGYVSKDFGMEIKASQVEPDHFIKSIHLPDLNVLTLKSEAFRCGEALFTPHVLGIEGNGIHEMCYNSIMKSPVDVRLNLYSNILLTGGSSLFPGIIPRFRDEIIKLAPMTVSGNINVIDDIKERELLGWKGGSILSSVALHYSSMWLHQADYQDTTNPHKGPGMVHKKFF